MAIHRKATAAALRISRSACSARLLAGVCAGSGSFIGRPAEYARRPAPRPAFREPSWEHSLDHLRPSPVACPGVTSRPGSIPLWEQRFRAPVLGMPDWSPGAPDRLAFASTESGVWQLNVLDLAVGMRRRVTDHPVGVTDGTPTLDGRGVVWFQDETGDESGQWLMQSFEGGKARPFLEGIPQGWNEGLAQAGRIFAAAVSDRDGFAVYVSAGGGAPQGVGRGP